MPPFNPITTSIILKANGVAIGTIGAMTITQDTTPDWELCLRGEASHVIFTNTQFNADRLYHAGYQDLVDIEWYHGETVAILRNIKINEWHWSPLSCNSDFSQHGSEVIDVFRFRFDSLEYLKVDLDEPLTTKTIAGIDMDAHPSTTTEEMFVVQPEPIEEKLPDPLITGIGILGVAVGAFISKAYELSQQVSIAARVEDDIASVEGDADVCDYSQGQR